MKKIIRKFLNKSNYRIYNVKDNPGHDLEYDLRIKLTEKLNPVIFDIGANHGELSSSFLKLFPSSIIHAFEPTPSCCESLLKIKRHNENFNFHEFAIGDKDEQKDFNFSNYTTISSFLDLKENGDNKTNVKEINVRAIDSVASELGIDHIDLLKIDTQGYDLKVLNGAQNMLKDRKIGAILIELSFKSYYLGQASFVEVFEFLIERDLNLYGLYDRWYDSHRIDHCDGLFILAP